MDPSTQVDPDNDEVFISGLPLDTTEQDIAEYFGQIGVIKQDKKRRGMPKVWLYKDKSTGEFNGDATVTYEDPFAAMSAPNWFDGKEYKGATLKVSLSTRKAEAAVAYEKKMQERSGGRNDYGGDRRGGYNREGYHRDNDRGGRGNSRPGDWTCPTCGNNCFARKDSCNRCGTQKPRDAGGAPGYGGYGGRGGGRGGGGNRREGDWECQCGNMCFSWRDVCNRCGAQKPASGNRSSRPSGGHNEGGRDGGRYSESYDRNSHGHSHHHRGDRPRDRSRSPRRHDRHGGHDRRDRY